MQGSLKNLFVKPLDMPKLLQINVTANWGSTGKIAEQIGLAAMDAGWESYLAYSRNSNNSQSSLIKIGSRLGTLWHVLQARLFDRAGLGGVIATKKLIREIDSIRPDIVHLHNIHGYVLNYKLLFEYINKVHIPVVWTFHDFWAITGHCAFFYQCDKWRYGCGRCDKVKDYPYSFMDNSQRNILMKKQSYAESDLSVVTVSEWMKDFVKESILKDAPVCAIPNGIDIKVFHPVSVTRNIGLANTDYVIMAVAIKWDARKGFQDYIRLSGLLAEDEKIVLVGLDEKQIKQLPSGIIGLQKTDSQEQLAELYSRADVVLSLSYAETFGLTIAESMACGTPVIAYDNTAQADLLTEETGIKVKTGDVDGVYEAIRMMRKIGKDHFSQACRARAEEHFDKEKCFKKYIELYEEILNRSK